jgi:pimeloyl-ACP methyl ester carboxylesterase
MRFVALDQRSQGRSDRMRSGDTLAAFVDDSRQVIATLELDRPILVGHLWGASIALELAARHPDTVLALGFLDGPAWRLSETVTWPEFAARSQSALPRHSDLSAAIDAARVWHGPLWGEDLIEVVHAGHRSEGDAVVRRGRLSRFRPLPRSPEEQRGPGGDKASRRAHRGGRPKGTDQVVRPAA